MRCIYSSQLGMAQILRDSHWLCEANVANVQYPRSYNVSRETEAFLTDYRTNACTGLLKWYVGRVDKGEAFVDLGIEPIPISQLEFALERCEEFLAETRNQNIDIENDCKKSINEDEWNSFLDDYSRVLHRGNGIASLGNSDAQLRLEVTLNSLSHALFPRLTSSKPHFRVSLRTLQLRAVAFSFASHRTRFIQSTHPPL